jgi:glycopeptide antibiotics resistance protein
VFHQVPVLPVVIPVATLAFAVLLWSLHRRARLTPQRAAVSVALCVYLAGVIANTVFPIFLDKPSSDQPWDNYLNLVPLVGYDVVDAVTNVVVFVPLGVLLPLFFVRPSWWRALLLGAGLSLLIEVSQYVTANLLGGGHVADVNDLFFNVVGTGVGLALLEGVRRIPGAGRVVDGFRWH